MEGGNFMISRAFHFGKGGILNKFMGKFYVVFAVMKRPGYGPIKVKIFFSG